MSGGSDFPWKCAGLLGIVAFSQTAYIVYKWLKESRGNSSNIHKVLFMNPLVCSQKCREINCPGTRSMTTSNVFKEIAKKIDSAKFSIDLAIYVLTCIEVANALRRAQERQVRVRVVADNSLACSTGSQIPDLMKKIPVLLYNGADGLMHHKFCLIDAPSAPAGGMDTVFGGSVNSAIMCASKWFCGKSSPESERNSILITGSLNWTLRGATSNFENVIITTNGDLIRDFQAEFQRLWTHLSANSS
ncbi:mitochondrial cardiolipin hydrolase [Phlebotomus argentipes]|uniref:mitochondrial cardiolipin hydrolase n=1 Tax=Phlebotomus argentipes TaxID=94469 RepID=UPI00289304C7|nr:mitochondrial cardiolipin hydrolase [Phlebotomus argentipes]XP_059619049.1 mitochondrial cardiolipin hydrolase [Phlebotomus argentipes]